MSSQLSIQELRSLPKIDLHRHLDCSMRWSTLLEIATTLKLDFPQNVYQQHKHFLITEPMVNLGAVLNKFLVAQKVLASTEILERLAYEVCEDAFNDGVRILELRYAPTFITDGHPELSFEKIHQAFLKGIAHAQKKMPIAVGLICILQRTLPIEKVAYVTDFAIENKDTFIALDLADNEESGEPKLFAQNFSKAKSHGLHITIHTGESPSPQSGLWIKEAVELLGAERLGHGVQIIHHPELIEFVKKNNITLEVCPYSNYLTQAFKTYEDHPLKNLYDLQVPLTLNSDDPGIFASTLTDEYLIAQKYHGFTYEHFNNCLKQAFKASFISQAEKEKVMKGFLNG